MSLFVDIGKDSVNKYGQELCGDNVEIRHSKDSIVVVLSDGLGSGVKANILATMTSTIAATMLQESMPIFEVVETLEETLPECQVRKLSYSTFTIVQIFPKTRRAYIFEYDNPPLVYIRDGEIIPLERKDLKFKDKHITEATLLIEEGDVMGFFSDGVIHAGLGKILNFGWQWEDASDYLLARTYDEDSKTAQDIAMQMVDTCNELYGGKPGDDTTVVVLKIEQHEYATLFSGPPFDRSKDQTIKAIFDEAKGIKIVCGGTASNIISREYDEEIKIDLDTMSEKVPPIGRMPSIDLVTEGVITIRETVNIISGYINKRYTRAVFKENNAASILANTLVNNCTHITMILGNSINPVHQNPDFPNAINSKWRITQKLIELLRTLNKSIEIIYI